MREFISTYSWRGLYLLLFLFLLVGHDECFKLCIEMKAPKELLLDYYLWFRNLRMTAQKVMEYINDIIVNYLDYESIY